MRVNYLLRLWLSTLFLAPLLYSILAWIIEKDESVSFGIYFFMLVYGLMFSFPTFFICLLLIFIVGKKIRSNNQIKLMLIAVSLVCMVTTFFYLFEGSELTTGFGALLFSVLYGSCIIVLGLLLKIKKEDGV